MYFKIYLIAINIITFFLFGLDKKLAKNNMYRISEKCLMIFAIIGGSFGAFIGMKVFHHKTLHKKFNLGIPVIIVIQALLIFLCPQINNLLK